MENSVGPPPQTVVEYPTTSKLRFSLNGQLVEVDNPDPRQLLVHWLRQSGYPGTKVSLAVKLFSL